ncbi:hypothetical protein MnTg02_03472 [bacterium MnTg02]|nr:hypothetical protein MnTg02_03472 [bacterium MnTg02]
MAFPRSDGRPDDTSDSRPAVMISRTKLRTKKPRNSQERGAVLKSSLYSFSSGKRLEGTHYAVSLSATCVQLATLLNAQHFLGFTKHLNRRSVIATFV